MTTAPSIPVLCETLQPLVTGFTAISEALHASTFLNWRDITWGKEEQLTGENTEKCGDGRLVRRKGRKDALALKLTLPTHTQKLCCLEVTSPEDRLFGLYPCHLLTLFPPLPLNSFCLTSVSTAFLTPCPSFFVWQIQGSVHTLCNSEEALPCPSCAPVYSSCALSLVTFRCSLWQGRMPCLSRMSSVTLGN